MIWSQWLCEERQVSTLSALDDTPQRTTGCQVGGGCSRQDWGTVLGFYCCDKPIHQSNLGREGIISSSSPRLQSIIKESQGRYSKQKPRGRNWSRGQKRMWLPCVLSCFLIQFRSPCPVVAPPIVAWPLTSRAIEHPGWQGSGWWGTRAYG